ncbi:uncharacterized protein N7515_004911 [Penicillium bovifimosum]|uniref:Uncharacterized protein n=1 Tax=Penicillium bovifimosum TaxID=126998 RepID=A0A9W9L3S8_9EURO|nr:uncharacterized protein N7515_004911 [Penicillium bovifimosum]KAJ5135633.1 hypothetical protein N7515_004911 [Penicillium bovifimosum]
MASNTRITCFDARLLRGLVGTTVTTYDLVSDDASVVPRKHWVITKKLIERAAPMTDHDVKMGRGSAKTVGKFLCHAAEDPSQEAFMRIYQQIPLTGTEDADHDTLARQAVAPGVCGEFEAFKRLQSAGCGAVPRFLGHAESTQGDNDLLPGGYIRYLVWEKVPGSL